MKLMVDMRPLYDGRRLKRWEEEEDPRGLLPKAKKRQKKTKESEPRTTDENDKPRMKTRLWIALRDRDNPNRRQLQ